MGRSQGHIAVSRGALLDHLGGRLGGRSKKRVAVAQSDLDLF